MVAVAVTVCWQARAISPLAGQVPGRASLLALSTLCVGGRWAGSLSHVSKPSRSLGVHAMLYMYCVEV